MMPSRTRVVDTLVGLLVLTVVALAVVPWLVPRIQEAARDKPDPDLVLTAVKKHQAVLDAEWTNPEASTGAAPPMQAELMIRDARKQLTQDGIPVTSATSEVKRIRPTYQGDGNVHVIAEVSTSKTYADVSGTTSVETNRHTLVLTGNDDRGYSVVSDEIVDPARPSPPVDIQHRADLMGLGVSIVFVSIAVVAVVLSRRNRAHLPRGISWLPFGGTFALTIGVAWGYTVGSASTQDDFGDTMSCLGERVTSLDSRLESGDGLWHGCVAHSRIDVALALVIATAVIVVEYLILNEDPRLPEPDE